MLCQKIHKNPCRGRGRVHTLDKVCNGLFIILIGFETDLLLGFFFHLHKLVDGLKDSLELLVVLLFHGQNFFH